MTDPKAAFPHETVRGSFVRQPSAFRNWVTTDGSSDYPAEPGRYHLYVSLACPWAHRTVIVRSVKRLEDVISMTILDPIRDHRSWAFTADSGPDPINGFEFLAEAYLKTDPNFVGRVTVPVLWDKQEACIVNNESSEIIRMLDGGFDAWGDASVDLYPQDLREMIDDVNVRIYDRFNNGVYRAGFATSAEAYSDAFHGVFDTLDAFEQHLADRRYLAGDQISEADWRFFTTLIRFDSVYYSHFKCNKRRIVDYGNLWAYTRDLYQQPGVAATVSMDHIKRHYFVTHTTLNPTGIVPLGPELDLSAPHGRDSL